MKATTILNLFPVAIFNILPTLAYIVALNRRTIFRASISIND